MSLSVSATEYRDQIRNGTITVEEFVSKTLEKIKKVDEQIRAFITVNDDAINQARNLDKKLKTKEKVGACLGMPISIKDNICTKGIKTTCASKLLHDFVAPYDATVISRLKAEDAIIIGKTNLDEFAMGLTTEFSCYGPTKNPWNVDCVPGGSSGGSAAAVSTCESIVSLGSDTGGSVRNPASFCSVFGLKPTYGLVSRYGLVSYANSIEQIGPMARTVEDIAFLMNIIAGQDPNDNTTIDSGAVDYVDDLDAGISGKKIGIVSEMMGEGEQKEVTESTRNAISKLEELGADCEEISISEVLHSVAAYYTLTAAEASSNLARYDNIRYGYDFGVEGFEFNAYISRSRKNFGEEVIRRMLLGTYVLSSGYFGKYYMKAQQVRSLIKTQVERAFQKVDLLISPTVPSMPFKLGEKINDELALFRLDVNTVTANLANIPAISVPFEVKNGLPIGIQLFAGHLQEKLLFQAAHALSKLTKLPEPPI